MNWQTILALGAVGLVGVVILIVLGPQIVRSVKRIRAAVEAG
ncbi:hypothetical protein [Nitratireductor pacificus]|nr:hypothetical protein [Nitratireductor pacificus]